MIVVPLTVRARECRLVVEPMQRARTARWRLESAYGFGHGKGTIEVRWSPRVYGTATLAADDRVEIAVSIPRGNWETRETIALKRLPDEAARVEYVLRTFGMPFGVALEQALRELFPVARANPTRDKLQVLYQETDDGRIATLSFTDAARQGGASMTLSEGYRAENLHVTVHWDYGRRAVMFRGDFDATRGDVTWRSALGPRGVPLPLEPALEAHAAVLDWLLAQYFSGLRMDVYTVTDAPPLVRDDVENR